MNDLEKSFDYVAENLWLHNEKNDEYDELINSIYELLTWYGWDNNLPDDWWYKYGGDKIDDFIDRVLKHFREHYGI